MNILVQGLIALIFIFAIAGAAIWVDKKFDHWEED